MAQFISIVALDFSQASIDQTPTIVLPALHSEAELLEAFIDEHTPTLTSMQAVGYEFRGAEEADGYLTLPMVEALPASAWEHPHSTHYARYNRTDLY